MLWFCLGVGVLLCLGFLYGVELGFNVLSLWRVSDGMWCLRVLMDALVCGCLLVDVVWLGRLFGVLLVRRLVVVWG